MSTSSATGAAGPVDSEDWAEADNTLITGEAVALDLRPTSFVLRAAGSIIDFIVYLGSYIALIIFVFPILIESLQLDDAVIAAVAITLLVVAIVVAPTAVETLSKGRSLGKLAIGARVVRDDGGAIGFRHAFIRSLLAVVEIYFTFGGLAAIIGLLDGRAKRLGDLVAGTYSQNERIAGVAHPIYSVPSELQEWAETADVARMPDRLSRRIARFLMQAPALTPSTRDRLSRELAVEASPYVAPLPSVSAELFLAAVAAVRREREFTGLMLERERLTRLDTVLTGLPHGFPRRESAPIPQAPTANSSDAA
ncbi:MAG: RDD family protein [Microbacteriaceae bacterium]